jgi:hypothetical protein
MSPAQSDSVSSATCQRIITIIIIIITIIIITTTTTTTIIIIIIIYLALGEGDEVGWPVHPLAYSVPSPTITTIF